MRHLLRSSHLRLLSLGGRPFPSPYITLPLQHVRNSSTSDSLGLSELTAITAIDGRYARHTKALRQVFSEFALIRNRVLVEVKWLEKVCRSAEIRQTASLSADSLSFLSDLVRNFSVADAERVKEIERRTNHDVKAVEYFLKEKVSAHAALAEMGEFIHFTCTSEDINNLSYALMLQQARKEILLPEMQQIVQALVTLADAHRQVPLLARTHGQPATPTTLGKELANFAFRLSRQVRQVESVEVLGKINGAVGNFAAHMVTLPAVDWARLGKEFVEEDLQGLVWNPYTTQIEPHDFVAELCDAMARFNTVLLDFDRDMW